MYADLASRAAAHRRRAAKTDPTTVGDATGRRSLFYSDVDFIRAEKYSGEDADRAISDALYALEAARQLIAGHA